VSVVYTKTGELLVCDQGVRKIFVFSVHLENLLEISLVFTPPMNPLLLDKQVEPDPIPVTMSLSPEGQLAVGFKRGGLLVLRAYRHYPIGALDKLTVMRQLHNILRLVHPHLYFYMPTDIFHISQLQQHSEERRI